MYECNCGAYIRNIDSVLLPPAGSPTADWRLQHGENREAVYVLNLFNDWSVELEDDMEAWTKRVHDYEARREYD